MATPIRCRFHQHFFRKFLYKSVLRNFFLISVWLCNFFGKRISVQKLLVKCRWKWLQIGKKLEPSNLAMPTTNAFAFISVKKRQKRLEKRESGGSRFSRLKINYNFFILFTLSFPGNHFELKPRVSISS